MTDTIFNINGKLVTIPELAKSIKNIITSIPSDKTYTGCWFWRLGQIGDHDFAIVIGWEFGYETDKLDPLCHNNHHLAIKLGCQPHRSIMQCDFEVDWTMPYDPKTGDIEDTCTAIYTYDSQEYLEMLISNLIETYILYRDNPDKDLNIIRIKRTWGLNYYMDFDTLKKYIHDHFTLDGTSQHIVNTIISYVNTQGAPEEDSIDMLSYLLSDIGITEQEIKKVLITNKE